MKIFVFIFSFYLLAISVMPCSDAHNECSDLKTEWVQGHNHRNDSKDFCSPFCNCNCCNVTTTFSGNDFNQKPVLPVTDAIIKFPSTNFFFVSDYNGNIWQPPRIIA